MESTKAKIIGVVQQIYDAVVNIVPKDTGIEPLHEAEEIDGLFAVFFTNTGSRGMAVGTLDHNEVISYLREVLGARELAMQRGKMVVTSQDIEDARNMLGT